ncbi:hypothetical protein NW761_010450 [Fusarium oxysporum]|uniref:Uncharacterized protein n=1 Tax=Fusarium oxysporum f. sp. pisi HDV247 TaxID=1080344 RepID=W9NMK7_FUSOX|nr:hypothetical protein FOVG_14857 [Fusarium oxysporum f. sp. pisi HDV247]KAJ4038936.1 hypothetical protein NW758_008782 [Fusarium oxysporum]KAJ4081900.1 hypothetical protein NW761_010450 [Fusarium oxysporum]
MLVDILTNGINHNPSNTSSSSTQNHSTHSQMASLVPIDPKGITAKYHGLTGKLILHAEGKIPGFFLTPFFEQDVWEGGLRFAVKAYSGGFAKLPDEKHVDFTFELPILLPIPHFNNKSVLVETAFGTSEIDIQYLEWAKPPKDISLPLQATGDDTAAPTSNSDKKPANTTTIYPPKDFWLSDKGTLEIIALVPKQLTSLVNIDFNPEFIKLVATSYEGGFIKWTISWAKIPDPENDPQRINVITTIKPEVEIQIWPPIPHIRFIQPYLIHRMWMLSDQKE